MARFAVIVVICGAVSMAAGGLLQAQQGHGSHGGHSAPSAIPRDAASRAFAAANARMHKDMAFVASGNADVDFVRGMIPHHQGAIDMADIVLKFGKDAEVQNLANGIIAAQRREMAQMSLWLATYGSLPPGPDAAAVSRAYAQVNAAMHKDMSIKLTGKADADFMRGMVPHHVGAVEMAKVVLAFGKDSQLKLLAEQIISSQSGEIALMKAWLQKNGG